MNNLQTTTDQTKRFQNSETLRIARESLQEYSLQLQSIITGAKSILDEVEKLSTFGVFRRMSLGRFGVNPYSDELESEAYLRYWESRETGLNWKQSMKAAKSHVFNCWLDFCNIGKRYIPAGSCLTCHKCQSKKFTQCQNYSCKCTECKPGRNSKPRRSKCILAKAEYFARETQPMDDTMTSETLYRLNLYATQNDLDYHHGIMQEIEKIKTVACHDQIDLDIIDLKVKGITGKQLAKAMEITKQSISKRMKAIATRYNKQI